MKLGRYLSTEEKYAKVDNILREVITQTEYLMLYLFNFDEKQTWLKGKPCKSARQSYWRSR